MKPTSFDLLSSMILFTHKRVCRIMNKQYSLNQILVISTKRVSDEVKFFIYRTMCKTNFISLQKKHIDNLTIFLSLSLRMQTQWGEIHETKIAKLLLLKNL